MALGFSTSARGNFSSAVGRQAQTEGVYATALGYLSKAKGESTTALGDHAESTIKNSVALGSYSKTSVDAGVQGYDPSLGRNMTQTEILGGNRADYEATLAKIATLEAEKAELENKLGAYIEANDTDGKTDDERAAIKAERERQSNKIADKNQDIRIAQQHANKIVSTWQSTAAAISVGDEGQGITRQITNVAAGSKDTDAVNVAQLKRVAATVADGVGQDVQRVDRDVQRLDRRVNKINKDLRAGIAGVTALSFLQSGYRAGESAVSVAVGTYKGESALAVGYGRRLDNNKVEIKLGASLNTSNDMNAGGSIGYHW